MFSLGASQESMNFSNENIGLNSKRTSPAVEVTSAPRGVLVLMCAMPVAVIRYLVAETHAADGRHVAGAVIVSTLASFVMLPPLL